MAGIPFDYTFICFTYDNARLRGHHDSKASPRTFFFNPLGPSAHNMPFPYSLSLSLSLSLSSIA